MGQILVVHGEDQTRVRSVFAAALRSYESLCDLKPSSRLSAGFTELAKFPRLHAPTAGIVRSPNEEHWICGAGTYFYGGETAPACLDSLLRAMCGPEGPDGSHAAEIDGIFAIACGSHTGEDLQIITDRLGSLHIYLATVDSCVVVSTSSMILASLLRPRWNLTACREFLGTGTIFEQRTLFEGVEKLEPATVFHFHQGQLRSRGLYTDISQAMYDRSHTRGDVPQLAEALQEAILTIGKNFPNPLCDLTGGFDSRAILGAMIRSGCDFQTVVNGAPDLPDVISSKRIAERLAIRHLHQRPRIQTAPELWQKAKASLPLCDGEYELLLYAGVYDVHSRLAERFDATINGSNGEICKGYWWELLFPFTGRRNHFDERLVAAKRFAFERVPELLDHAFENSLVDHFADVIRRANRRVAQHPNTAQMDNVYLTLRMQRWQGRIASATSRIWPCVSPFMWRKPMELALSAPPSTRVRNRMARRLIEYFNPALAAIPLAQGYPALPLRWNTAHLFWPLAVEVSQKAGQKLARALPYYKPPAATPGLHSKIWRLEEVRELLNPSTMTTRDLFRTNELQAVIGGSNGNSAGNSRILGRILTLELLASKIRSAPPGD